MNQSFYLKSLFNLLFFVCINMIYAVGGYEIQVKLEGYTEKQLILGFQLGDKSYIKDSTNINSDGVFIFKGTESLKPGVYIVLMKPENQYFQVLIDDNDQNFSLEANGKEPLKTCKFKGSKYNTIFYDYLRFIDNKRVEVEGIRAKIDAATSQTEKDKLSKELDKINEGVRQYQDLICTKDPGSLMGLIIKGSQDIIVPEFNELSDSLKKIKRYYYYKDHYFDQLPLANEKLLRSSMLFQKVDYFINKLSVQHPDTVCASIDKVLKLMQPNEEIFKFYLIHFLNFYAKTNIVGFDGVYVCIVENYYGKGLAPWTEEEQLNKIMKEARQLKPILIGKTAPNIKMFKQDGTNINLYDVDADYTVLMFWNPECGHCKKEMPTVIAWEKKLKAKGENVKMFAVCTALSDKASTCWDFVKEKNMDGFINVIDPTVSSGYYSLYKVTQTPMIFILDRNHKIISKRISPEQLEEVIDSFLLDKEIMKK